MRNYKTTTLAIASFILAISSTQCAEAQSQKQKYYGAEQKGTCRGEDCAQHCNRCQKKHKHWHHPPFAPVLASTPALMSPIILAPTRPVAARRPELDAELLRDLLSVLRGTETSASPERAAAAADGSDDKEDKDDDKKTAGEVSKSRAAAIPRPGESTDNRFDRIDRQLSALQQSMATIDKEAARAIKNLNERLKKLEDR